MRAVYSRNTEGRGRRLQDPVPAGLTPGSALSHDDTSASKTEISAPKASSPPPICTCSGRRFAFTPVDCGAEARPWTRKRTYN